MKVEIRSFSTPSPIRIEGRTLYGTAIPYNSLSRDLGGFKERFLPGSVTDAVKSGLIEAHTYHDRTKPLGSQAGGTLRLLDTPDGLNYEVDLPDTSYANDLIAMMKDGRKDIGGTSFGFWADDDGQRWTKEKDIIVRDVVKAGLDHISPVITPAYATTTAMLRSAGLANVDPADLYGIDLEAVAKIFLATRKGLIVEKDERDLAVKAISLLRSAITRPLLEAAEKQASNVLL